MVTLTLRWAGMFAGAGAVTALVLILGMVAGNFIGLIRSLQNQVKAYAALVHSDASYIDALKDSVESYAKQVEAQKLLIAHLEAQVKQIQPNFGLSQTMPVPPFEAKKAKKPTEAEVDKAKKGLAAIVKDLRG